MTNKKMFAKNLKYLRSKHGLEQQDISNMLGLKSPTSVTNWERGNNLARSGHISDLANYFGVTMHDLVNSDLEEMQWSYVAKITQVSEQLDEPRQAKVYEFATIQLGEQNSTIEETSQMTARN